MLLSFFEKYIFLQSLGWGIANSLWQAGLLWMLYKLVITANKNLSALFKHHLSLLLLFLSFAWFAVTTVQNYLVLQNSGGIAVAGWLYISKYLHTALQYLSVVYIVFLLLHSMQFIKRFTSLHFIRNRQLLKAPVDTRIFTMQTALHIGISKKVSIWLSENVEVPSVIGFFKPVILLPVTSLNHLTTQQAESIILHELAHIKRNDYLVNLLQSFIELVLFFNPFAKLLGNAARKERENCCDDWVLNYQYNKHDYAAALLMLEQQRTQRVTLALAATNGKKNLLGRIKRLFVATPQTNINFSHQIKLAFFSFSVIAAMFFILPTLSREASIEQTAKQDYTILPAPVAIKTATGNFKKTVADKIINGHPLQTLAVTEKTKASKKPVEKEIAEIEYSTALVNEELLKGEASNQNTALVASAKESTTYPKLLVQVEEEQSGVKEKNTYLLQLKNNNGLTEIKPLLMLNKKMKPVSRKLKAINKAAQADSLKLPLKERITS